MMRDRKNDNHRKVMAGKLGKPLDPGMDVDHIDGDKDNNDPANLRVMEHGAHTRHSNRHRTTQKVREALAMVKKGKRSY